MGDVTMAAGAGVRFWGTASPDRTVLAVVHTVATLRSVLDAVDLLESDMRVQTLFALAPDVLTGGRQAELRRLHGLEISWEEAVRADFDLVIAADSGHLYELNGPIIKLPHGVMNNKVVPDGVGDPVSGLVVGLSRPWLTHYGRVVPASIAVTHTEALETLAMQCPEASPRAVLTGDVCLDRLLASTPHRERYRAALGVRDDRPLVAITSTWGRVSLYGRAWRAMKNLIMTADDVHFRAVLHPAAWYTHGPRQIRAWSAAEIQHGLRWVDPIGWRGLVAAADVVIGDHGSAATYAAAAGIPVLCVPPLPGVVTARSAAAALANTAPQLRADHRLADQLDVARERRKPVAEAVAGLVTSFPGGAAARLRSEMYRLLRLTEPAQQCAARPVESPVMTTADGLS